MTIHELTCKRLFGRSWHTITELKRRDGVKECYWCGLKLNVNGVLNPLFPTYVNIWGNVCVLAGCVSCFAAYHGLASDSIPEPHPGELPARKAARKPYLEEISEQLGQA